MIFTAAFLPNRKQPRRPSNVNASATWDSSSGGNKKDKTTDTLHTMGVSLTKDAQYKSQSRKITLMLEIKTPMLRQAKKNVNTKHLLPIWASPLPSSLHCASAFALTRPTQWQKHVAQPQRPRGLLKSDRAGLPQSCKGSPPTSLVRADVSGGLVFQCQHTTSSKDGDWCRAKGSDNL